MSTNDTSAALGRAQVQCLSSLCEITCEHDDAIKVDVVSHGLCVCALLPVRPHALHLHGMGGGGLLLQADNEYVF